MNGRGTTAAFWGAIAVGTVLLAVLAAGGTNEVPLDPRSVSDDGAKGLVDLLGSFDIDVRLGSAQPGPDTQVALLLSDTFSLAQRDMLELWVRDGGILVVADPLSPLTPRTRTLDSAAALEGCEVAAFADVGSVTGPDLAFRLPSDGQLCFADVLAIDPVGDGTILSLAGPRPLLNSHLDQADNAVLALRLLVPADGLTVAFLEPRLVAGPEAETLSDLIPDPLWVLLAQSVVAFLIYAWWRARRLGAPVPEPALVQIAGSELAAARGRLLENIRRPGSAAADLRSDTRRRLLRPLGLPSEAPTQLIAQRVAPLAQITPEEATALLETRPVMTDADLHDLSVGLANIRSSTVGELL